MSPLVNVVVPLVLQLLVPGLIAGSGPPVGVGDAPRRDPAVPSMLEAKGVWPLAPPEVAHDFAPPATTYGPGHRGVDLAGEPGQRVRAARGGRVSYAGILAGRGVVVVDHGQKRTTYEPVDATVRRGAVVEAGQSIGTLQRAGSHCFPRACLHWGLLEGETYLDPLTLVDVGPPRLLPWHDPLAP